MTSPVKVVRHGAATLENPRTDPIRREECMCLSCSRLIPGDATNSCPVANLFYQGCRIYEAAVMVTRCKEFEAK